MQSPLTGLEGEDKLVRWNIRAQAVPVGKEDAETSRRQYLMQREVPRTRGLTLAHTHAATHTWPLLLLLSHCSRSSLQKAARTHASTGCEQPKGCLSLVPANQTRSVCWGTHGASGARSRACAGRSSDLEGKRFASADMEGMLGRRRCCNKCQRYASIHVQPCMPVGSIQKFRCAHTWRQDVDTRADMDACLPGCLPARQQADRHPCLQHQESEAAARACAHMPAVPACPGAAKGQQSAGGGTADGAWCFIVLPRHPRAHYGGKIVLPGAGRSNMRAERCSRQRFRGSSVLPRAPASTMGATKCSRALQGALLGAAFCLLPAACCCLRARGEAEHCWRARKTRSCDARSNGVTQTASDRCRPR